MLKHIKSLYELQSLAKVIPAYAQLVTDTARNLGGDVNGNYSDDWQWLTLYAGEMGDAAVVDEVNFLADRHKD